MVRILPGFWAQDLPRPVGCPRGSNPGQEKLRTRKKNFRSAHYGECFAETLFLQGFQRRSYPGEKFFVAVTVIQGYFPTRLTCLLGLEAKLSSRAEASKWTRPGCRWTGTRSGFPVGPRLAPDPVQLPSRNRLDSSWFPAPAREREPPQEKFEDSWHATRKLLSWGGTHSPPAREQWGRGGLGYRHLWLHGALRSRLRCPLLKSGPLKHQLRHVNTSEGFFFFFFFVPKSIGIRHCSIQQLERRSEDPWTSRVAQWYRMSGMWETWVRFLRGEDLLRRVWQPTPALLSGEFHGLRNLAGYSPWSSKESGHDLATKTPPPRIYTKWDLSKQKRAVPSIILSSKTVGVGHWEVTFLYGVVGVCQVD